MNTLKIVRLAAWGVIGILTLGLGYVVLAPKPATQVTGTGAAHLGGPFRLKAADGTMVEADKLKGRPFALFFGFTQCPDVCPTAMLELTTDMQALGDLARDFRVYFVTVDPERDDAETLRQYTASFDPRIIGLIPKDAAELEAVAKSYRAIFRKVPTPSGYTMDHTAAIYLMDAKGQFAGTLDSKEPPAIRQAKLKRLLKRDT